MALTLEQLQHLMLNLQNALAVGVGEAVGQALQENLGQSGVGLKTEQCHKNMVEALVKRIESFNGIGFQDWKFKFEMAVNAIQTGALDMLQTSETSEKEVCFSSEIEQQISSQIYFILAQKLQGEAFDLVKNVPELNGIEAWRRMCNRFDARTLGKRVHLIRKCVNPPKIKKLQEAMGMIERWEDSTTRLQAEYDEHISDGLKMGILLEMVPPNITEALMARLPDKNAKDENGKEIAKYPITKEILTSKRRLTLEAQCRWTAGILIFTTKETEMVQTKATMAKYTHSEKDSVARAAVSEEKVAHLFQVSATHVASTDTNLPIARKNGRAGRAVT